MIREEIEAHMIAEAGSGEEEPAEEDDDGGP